MQGGRARGRLADRCTPCISGAAAWHTDFSTLGRCAQVSSYMRAVLRTIAQCHSQRILHRDIKPGNFMLLSDSPKAPLKAIGERQPHRPAGHVTSGDCTHAHTRHVTAGLHRAD